MLEKLRIKAIYDDFVSNVTLTKEQVAILNMLINKDTIVKISIALGMSQRTVNYEIKRLKKLYQNYYDLQICKLKLLI